MNNPQINCEGAWTKENIALALGFIDEETCPPMIEVNPNDEESTVQATIFLVQHYMTSISGAAELVEA